MAFVRRRIKTTFALGKGNFGEAGQDQVDIEGLRTSARIFNAGGRSMGRAQVAIYGMTLSLMNQLSTLGQRVTQLRKNSITIAAGDASAGTLATVFQGTIYNAYGDFNASPDVPFIVEAQTGLFESVKPATPISVKGSADVATMLSGIASQMGMTFENNGVTAKLSNAYYAGSPRDQAVAIVKDAGIEWNSLEKGTLAIWNPGQSRGATVVLLSKETGLVGYPAYQPLGLELRTVFNPQLSLGTRIKVQSILTPANGEWAIYKLDHSIDSMVEAGDWFSKFLATVPGLSPPVA